MAETQERTTVRAGAARRWTAVGVLALAATVVFSDLAPVAAQENTPSPAASPPPMTAPDGGWTQIDDDVVIPTANVPAGGMTRGDAADVANGYVLFDGIRGMLGAYTIRLRPDPTIEGYRPYIQAAAAAASAATGATITVASGTTSATEPNSSEILLDITGDSPCGPLDEFGTVGCGGPQWWTDIPGSDSLVNRGNVWIAPAWQNLDETARSGLITHELGHALGLDHIIETYQGLQQVMYPQLNDASSYRAGDINGLKWMYAGRPKPYYPYNSWDAFAKQQLDDFTNNPGTTASRASTVTKLSNGSLTRASFIASLMNSSWSGGAISPLVRLYYAYFGRRPDNDGIRYWGDRRRAGVTVSKISQSFATSGEFIRKYGNLSNRSFVTRIYTDVLGRTADTAGVNFWTNKLNAGTARGQVMINFSESSEYQTKMKPKVDTILLHIIMVESVPDTADMNTGVLMSLSQLIPWIQVTPDYGGRPNFYCAKYCDPIWPTYIEF